MSATQLFWLFLQLGLSSFGGPTAHIGYFRQQFVSKLALLSDAQFQSLFSLCQILPGPTSSQLGMAIGWQLRGVSGLLAAFVGFTLPSFLLMAGMASLGHWALPLHKSAFMLWLLKGYAALVVAQALWQMLNGLWLRPNRSICLTLVLVSALVVSLIPGLGAMLALLVLACAWGVVQTRSKQTPGATQTLGSTAKRWYWPKTLRPTFEFREPRNGRMLFLTVAAVLALVLSSCGFASYLLSGGLVFGGGHVVLPLLQSQLQSDARLSAETVSQAYALAQAVPGPMFTMASFLGWSQSQSWLGALLATLAIFLPGAWLLLALLPHWQRLQQQPYLALPVDYLGQVCLGFLLSAALISLWLPIGHTLLTPPFAVVPTCLAFGLLTGCAVGLAYRVSHWRLVLVLLCGGLLISSI